MIPPETLIETIWHIVQERADTIYDRAMQAERVEHVVSAWQAQDIDLLHEVGILTDAQHRAAMRKKKSIFHK